MATATNTLTINAAFLQEIKDENLDLRWLLHDLRALFSKGHYLHVPSMRIMQLLEQLRDHLALHFSLEEAYGYFEDPISVAPQLCCRAGELRSEHALLYRQAMEMVEMSERLLYHEANGRVLDNMARAFQQFDTLLQRHEAGEQDLLTQAFSDDIGVGD